MSSSEPADSSIKRPSNGEHLPATYTITNIAGPGSNGMLADHGNHKSRDLNNIDSSELSDEGDIEIEHLSSGYDANAQSPHAVRGKRTVINIWQKAILEDYFRNGMTSASLQLHSLHAAAAEKTGLDLGVIKNWIRNRRRPAAARSAERLTSLISATVSTSPLSVPSMLPPIPMLSPSMAMSSILTPPSHLPPSLADVSAILAPPPVKRHNMEPHTASPTIRVLTTVPPSPQMSQAETQFLVKVRLSEVDDEDFVEVELSSLTYQSLLAGICDEFELTPSDVAKIRKLPNVLVRKDKDVQRLKEGQELEVVVNSTRLRDHHGNPIVSTIQSDNMPPGVSLQNLPSGHGHFITP